MNDCNGNSALARALQLSLEMMAVAEHGDASAVASLDAERLRLLDSQRHRSRHLDADERLMMQRISELNDRAIGLLQHRRRRIERVMDTAAVGRRAVVAYSSTGQQR
jgi:CBS domain containing-hemolysin-like protein